MNRSPFLSCVHAIYFRDIIVKLIELSMGRRFNAHNMASVEASLLSLSLSPPLVFFWIFLDLSGSVWLVGPTDRGLNSFFVFLASDSLLTVLIE